MRNALIFVLALVEFAIAADEVSLGKVGSTVLTPAMVRATAARNGYVIHDVTSASRALKETSEFEVLAAEAEKAGYFADPDILAVVKSMAIGKLVADKVDKVLPPKVLTEEQLSAYYKKHLDEFSRPAIAKGRVLFVSKKPGWEKKVDSIELALKKGASFVELIKHETEDAAGRVSDGMTTWLVEKRANRRYPEEVVRAIFSLKSMQEVSPKLDLASGVYWVQLVEMRNGDVTPYAMAKRSISRKLAEWERLEAYGAYVAGLKGAVPVTIDPLAVSNLLKDVSSGSLPPMGPVRIRPKK